jgi:nicotinamide mononucleotide transporter
MSVVEILGFVTGAVCVWLTVKQNIWNWPIGIANNVFYIVVFFRAALYADMALQVVYIVVSAFGWYWWLHGGARHTRLTVGRVGLRDAAILAILGAAATYGMMRYLESVGGSAPFLDALTTALSLIAQYLLSRKLLENWYVWIVADIIYVGLYVSKDLHLTAVLYAIFLAMCVRGFVEWRRSMAADRAVAVA